MITLCPTARSLFARKATIKIPVERMRWAILLLATIRGKCTTPGIAKQNSIPP
jgi:hypothetical protein